MSKGQVKIITQYIADHPGCTIGEIIRNTGQNKSSVSSTLCRLTAAKVFRREGSDKFYRYYIWDEAAVEKKSRSTMSARGPRETNHLNNLFNQCLASVRGGRAEV